jgi:hypothetical protein
MTNDVLFSLQVSKSSIKYIDGYYIRYRDVGEGKQAFNILTVVAQKHDFETYSHVIQNLRKYGQYQVFVSPFFKSVEGQPSNTKRVWTAQDRKFWGFIIPSRIYKTRELYQRKGLLCSALMVGSKVVNHSIRDQNERDREI